MCDNYGLISQHAIQGNGYAPVIMQVIEDCLSVMPVMIMLPCSGDAYEIVPIAVPVCPAFLSRERRS
jgi:hypothetical protein